MATNDIGSKPGGRLRRKPDKPLSGPKHTPPDVAMPVERYTPERKAEFLLSDATTEKDYQRARKQVRRLGLDPEAIPHRRPE